MDEVRQGHQTPPGRRNGGSQRRLATARSLGLLIAAVVGLVLLGLNRYGFPDGITRHAAESLSRGAYAVELERVTLDLTGGLVARQVRIYRKGVVGPPPFEARSVRLGLDPFIWRWGRHAWFRDVEVVDGVVRRLAEFVSIPPGAPAPGSAPGPVLPFASLAVRLRDVDVFGVFVEEGRADLRQDQSMFLVSRLSATVGRGLQRGTVAGSLTIGTDEVRARFRTAVDPHVLVPGLRAFGIDQTRVLDWFSFPTAPPAGEWTLEQRRGAAPELVVQGRLQASQFACRGTAIGFGNVTVAYRWSPDRHTVALNPLVLVVGGRTISGTLNVDLAASTARFEALSVADVPALARIIGFREGSFLDAFRFGAETRVYMHGIYDYGAGTASDAEIAVDSPTVGYGSFNAEDCAFKVKLAGETNLLQDVRGRLAGGSFTASAVFAPEAPGSTNTSYRVRVEVLHADLRALATVWGTNLPPRLEGRVYGNLDLAGLLGEGQGTTAAGQGYLNVKRGTIFRVPLFGGFTESMTRVVPGLDFVTRQTDVRAPFEVRGGRIESKDMQIEGDVLSLTARGNATLAGALDFDVQVRPMKDKTVVGATVRALTYPLSRLFEFHLSGTVDAPRWNLATFGHGKAAGPAE